MLTAVQYISGIVSGILNVTDSSQRLPGAVSDCNDADGYMNAADLLIMQRIITDQLTPGPVEQLHGDLYLDGVLNLQDLILQQQLILQ